MTKPSFAGNGLLERMRSTTFAILGIVAAMCLGLVAIVAQQALPVLPGLPLPGVSAEQGGRIDEARAAAAPRTGLEVASAAPVAGAPSGERRVQPERSGSPAGLSGSRELESGKEPTPVDTGDDGGPAPETPVAATPEAPPAEPAGTATSEPAPAASAPAGPAPGKATAAVDPPAAGDSETDEASAQDRADRSAEERAARGVSRGGRPARPGRSPVVPPTQEQVDTEAADEAAAEVVPAPPQAQADEDRPGSGGRGHGSRRFGR